MNEESEQFSKSKSLDAVCCWAFAHLLCQFQCGIAYKSIA